MAFPFVSLFVQEVEIPFEKISGFLFVSFLEHMKCIALG